jgi:hypothetical protein
VDEVVDQGGGDDVVAEDLAPAAEGFPTLGHVTCQRRKIGLPSGGL